jgi:hypothetical protein
LSHMLWSKSTEKSQWEKNKDKLSYGKCNSRGGMNGGKRPGLWWWWGCEPCQTPTGPDESIRLDWNPLGSTFDSIKSKSTN